MSNKDYEKGLMFAAGVGLGVLGAILFAPQAGREVRRGLTAKLRLLKKSARHSTIAPSDIALRSAPSLSSRAPLFKHETDTDSEDSHPRRRHFWETEP